jgi:hypothetical protein
MIKTDEAPKWPRRWPLALLAFPAGVATWSGWVGLGEKTGYGLVKPLPGIADTFTINSAIALPIGVEAYAAFALAAWLTSAPVSAGTRNFARWSALGSLTLGMFGQVAYHLLEVEQAVTAPAWVTIMVSCLPVLVLGAGAALAHLLHRDQREWTPEPEPVEPEPETSTLPESGDVHEAPELPAAPEPEPEPDREVTPEAAWASMTSDADKIRTAAAVLALNHAGGELPAPREVVEWLAERGHEVRESNARSVLRRERTRLTAPSSDH